MQCLLRRSAACTCNACTGKPTHHDASYAAGKQNTVIQPQPSITSIASATPCEAKASALPATMMVHSWREAVRMMRS